jgi:hypothetical protein
MNNFKLTELLRVQTPSQYEHSNNYTRTLNVSVFFLISPFLTFSVKDLRGHFRSLICRYSLET